MVQQFSGSDTLSSGAILQVLDWAYGKAIDGVPGLESAAELGDEYLRLGPDTEAGVNSLIRWQNTKAATSGFITGLGGMLAMPVMIPANIASVLFLQIRMIAAIAHMGEHGLRDDRVKSLIFACVAGNAAKDILKDVGIELGQQLTIQALKRISSQTINSINQKVGFRLLSKFGEKGAINMGKAVPLLGGLIGATFEAVATNTVGNIARDTFIVVDG